jgi:hypothetical protein
MKSNSQKKILVNKLASFIWRSPYATRTLVVIIYPPKPKISVCAETLLIKRNDINDIGAGIHLNFLNEIIFPT